ncbi:MAG: DUF1043 family protein [Alcanivoracaceae bacterium]|nr:DUF1043 family protein [Alcanivoracaceae bacterium]
MQVLLLMTDQLFYLFSAALFGLVIGALIMYFASGANRDSEKGVAEVEKKLNNYQQEVAQHFEQTADLVDELTQSYKKVFDHLGKSARGLMTDEQVQAQIEKRKGNKVTLEFLTDDSQSNEIGEKEFIENDFMEVDHATEGGKADESTRNA